MTMWMKRLGARKERGGDPEFQRLKTELTNVATALETAVRGLETLSADVTRVFGSVSKFANDFHSLYPSDDAVRRLGAAAVQSTDHLIEDAIPHADRIADLERGMRAYLAEIDGLRREFRVVAAARAEADTARDRYERLANRRAPDEARCAHARALADDRARAHRAIIRSLQARLASTYRKHAAVFQTAYTAYMLRLDASIRMLDKHMRPHRAHALKLDKTLARIQLPKSPSMHAGD